MTYNDKVIRCLKDVINILESGVEFDKEQVLINPYHLYLMHGHAEAFLSDCHMGKPN